MYQKVHAAIRENPSIARGATELGFHKTRSGAKATEFPKKQWQQTKISKQQRAGRIKQKLLARGLTNINA